MSAWPSPVPFALTVNVSGQSPVAVSRGSPTSLSAVQQSDSAQAAGRSTPAIPQASGNTAAPVSITPNVASARAFSNSQSLATIAMIFAPIAFSSATADERQAEPANV